MQPFGPQSSQLLYSTYFGGPSSEQRKGIAIDPTASGSLTQIHLIGVTTSDTGLPLANPYQATYGGGSSDAFIATIDPKQPPQSQLFHSTYFGGSGTDGGDGIAADSNGNVFIAGGTFSSVGFPILDPLPGGQILNGNRDAFVAKLSTTLPPASQLQYSTFLGGDTIDVARGIDTDGLGYVFVAGATGSDNFPTENPWQLNKGAGLDGFVTKIDEDGSDVSVELTPNEQNSLVTEVFETVVG